MYGKRIGRVLKELEKMKLEQMLVSDPLAIYYLTGVMNHPMERLFALLLRTDGGHVFFLNNMFVIDNRAGIREVWMDDTDDCIGIVAQNVDRTKDIGIDKVWPSRFLLGLMGKNPGVKYIDSSVAIDRVRMVKDSAEIELMRKSSHINDACMEEFSRFFKEGVSELEASDHVGGLFKKHGAARWGSSSLVCFGKNAADPHHSADGTRLKAGDCVLIDMGGVFENYISDMTRTFYYKSVSDKEREVYDIVLRANLLAESMIKPGVALRELDRAARELIAEAGYGDFFIHRLGHFIGTDCHEFGDVSSVSDIVAEEGMIFSIEPGIYLPGETGVRIEDLVLVTKDGCEVLNRADKALQIIG